MKYLIIMIILFSSSVMADEFEKTSPPEHKKNGTIIEVLPDGTKQTRSENDYMVVPRRKRKAVAKPAPKPYPEVRVVEKEVEKTPKNHLRLLAGVGPNGVSLERAGSLVTFKHDYGGLAGIEYGRNIIGRWSVEGSILTNSTFLLGAGYNW